MSKFNSRSASTRTSNLAGGKAFSMTPVTELVHAVLATFLKDQFYETGAERTNRVAILAEKVAKKDPEFVAKLAKVARSEFHLRSVVAVLLGTLARAHKGDDLTKRAIVSATERVDDLTELAAYSGMPMPKQVKRGIRNALLKFNRYQLAKYRGEGKAISLVDLFNLVHPKPQHANKEQKKAWKDLIEGKLISEDTWESEVSGAKDEKGRKKAFENLILEGKMGYMALIRNLNNLIKYGVSVKTENAAVKKLTDPEEIRKSKMLPFRFYTAFQNVKGNRKFSDAIVDAMEIALENVPVFKGKTLVAIDTSGSMSSGGGEDTTPLQKAAIFAAAMLKRNSADVILYDTGVSELSVSSRSSMMDIAEKIMREARGGGTETSLVFSNAGSKHYDRIIILSDNESWNDGYRSVQGAYSDYLKHSGANPFVYAIDIQGYGTTDLAKSKQVFYLVGWSERLFDFMRYAEQGESIVDYIRSVEL